MEDDLIWEEMTYEASLLFPLQTGGEQNARAATPLSSRQFRKTGRDRRGERMAEGETKRREGKGTRRGTERGREREREGRSSSCRRQIK